MLTEKQVQQLEKKDWVVKPFGCYIHLLRDDYSQDDWKDMCKTIGCNSDKDNVTVLIFGYYEK